MNQSKLIRLNFKRTLMVILALCLLVGCGTTDIQITPVDELTFFYNMYSSQHEDYLSMARNPNTREEQKVIMRKKKPILDALAVLIPAFDKSLTAGTNTPEQKQAIYDLLNSLGE